jgi:hypothetical protein
MGFENVSLQVEEVKNTTLRAGGRPIFFKKGMNWSATDFQVGHSYQFGGVTGDNGALIVTQYTKADGTKVGGAKSFVPKSNVTSTLAPGGDKPVQMKSKEEDKMSKEEWKAKDDRIAYLSILGSILKSPCLVKSFDGKSDDQLAGHVRMLFTDMLQIVEDKVSEGKTDATQA